MSVGTEKSTVNTTKMGDDFVVELQKSATEVTIKFSRAKDDPSFNYEYVRNQFATLLKDVLQLEQKKGKRTDDKVQLRMTGQDADSLSFGLTAQDLIEKNSALDVESVAKVLQDTIKEVHTRVIAGLEIHNALNKKISETEYFIRS